MILGALPLSLLAHDAQGLHSTTVSAGPIGDEKATFLTIFGPSSLTDNPPHNLGAPLSTNKTFYAWWNANWHYRIPFNVTGTGNVSATVDFTKNLTTLQMIDKTLENSTVTIVRYNHNGSVAGTVIPYNFIMNVSLQNDTNVYSGTLTWRVLNPSVYYVYFDVVTNRGNRVHLPTSNLSASGDAHLSFFGPPEGWWSELSPPLASYYPPNHQVNITVNTTAKADSVTARFYRNGTFRFSRTFITINHLRWINQTTFQQRGNWTVKINATDDAGYHATMLIAEFWVGYPDLALTKLNVISTPYYRGKPLMIQASVYCFNATLQQVNVSVYLSDTLVAHKNTLTFQKNHNTTVNFTWTSTTKGSAYLAVIIDPNNAIPESNEENNQRTMTLQIQGVPELGVVNITVPSQPVAEGDPATFHTCVTNKGDEDAINYLVNLYLGQTNSSLWIAEKGFTYINISMNHTVNISLVWGQVQYGDSTYNGKWMTGIRILSNDTKPDSDTGNNTLARYDRRLKVIPGDQNPPVVTLLSVPQIQEQGTAALFLVVATDASGIDTVTIVIKTPQNKYLNSTMTPLANNRYQYILKNTSMLGKYTYSITAVDLSFSKIKRTVFGSFIVVPDATPPTIEYFDAFPLVQLVNKTIEFQCITFDSSGILAVDVTITLPDSRTVVYRMMNASNDTKYTYVGRFSRIGRCEFTISVSDTLLNTNTTDPEAFWITRDLNDTDSDGMPDTWETQNGFNPYDPTDANQDADHDGVTNLEEYRAGTDPNSKPAPAPNALMDDWPYIIGFLIACVLIGGFAVYRSRRKKQ
jgi:hypothetical protein